LLNLIEPLGRLDSLLKFCVKRFQLKLGEAVQQVSMALASGRRTRSSKKS